ncbi:MAG: hypothetical protein HRT77_14155 [Halioglobus sp.]|nr:hypothetical protein [Halioglobus sp.]
MPWDDVYELFIFGRQFGIPYDSVFIINDVHPDGYTLVLTTKRGMSIRIRQPDKVEFSSEQLSVHTANQVHLSIGSKGTESHTITYTKNAGSVIAETSDEYLGGMYLSGVDASKPAIELTFEKAALSK